MLSLARHRRERPRLESQLFLSAVYVFDNTAEEPAVAELQSQVYFNSAYSLQVVYTGKYFYDSESSLSWKYLRSIFIFIQKLFFLRRRL